MGQEYYYEYKGDKKHELFIRNFLLSKADILRLTRVMSTEWKFPFTFIKYGHDKDEKFVRTMERLQHYFVKKIVNNKRFNDLLQGSQQFEHYFYRLSKPMKQKINKNTLFWWEAPYITGDFYCLEDPCFYRGKEMIGSVISHEQYIVLYLMPNEKNKLEKKGIVFSK